MYAPPVIFSHLLSLGGEGVPLPALSPAGGGTGEGSLAQFSWIDLFRSASLVRRCAKQ